METNGTIELEDTIDLVESVIATEYVPQADKGWWFEFKRNVYNDAWATRGIITYGKKYKVLHVSEANDVFRVIVALNTGEYQVIPLDRMIHSSAQ